MAKTWAEHKEMMEERLGSERMREISLITQLISRRIDKGLTQKELADRTGLKQSAIARLESETIIPKVDTLNKIAKELDLKLELVPNDNQKEKVSS